MSGLLAHIRLPRLGSRFHFARHLVEMFVAMMIGMPLGRLFFAAAYGSGGDETVRQHPVAWVLVMAAGMTVPMVAWMLYRGHSRRNAGEMAAAMIVPALPIVGLHLGHVVSGQTGGLYMSISTVAMIALIVFRRNEYRAAAGGHA